MPRADAAGETRTANAARVSRPSSPGLEPEQARGVESGSEPEVEVASDSELNPGWLGETGRWLLVVLAYSVAGCGLWAAMFELYFHGFHEVQQARRCDAQPDGGWTALGQDVENIVGAVPIWLRSFIMGALGVTVCRQVSGFGSDEPHVAQALLIGHGPTLGKAKEAGWNAIVGSRDSEASEALQSDWEQARDSRRLTMRQAVSSAVTKVLFWHASQPIVYLYVLGVYSCYVSSLGGWQRELAATVAVREVLYLASILLALWECPVFLLMDPVTAWNEAATRVEKMIRVAMYVLTPHNYVAFCLANRFRGWRRTFLGLAAIQVIADLASCFALGTLIAGGISSQKNTPTALIIGYTITAFGFLLFFGPLSVGTSLRAAADTAKSRAVRIASGVAGSALLFLLCYIVLLFVLLISGKVNPYCDGFMFQLDDPCNAHGTCYAAGQCHCEVGWGAEVSYTGEALCSDWYCDPKQYITLNQPWRSVNNTPHTFGQSGRLYRMDGGQNGTVGPGGQKDPAGECHEVSYCCYEETGVGGDQWYRFTGSGGNALPLNEPAFDYGPKPRCGTFSGGWLGECDYDLPDNAQGACSGFLGQDGSDSSKTTSKPGRYPAAAEGRTEMSVCSFHDKYGEWSCHPALVLRCTDFLLWNFGPSQVQARVEGPRSVGVTQSKIPDGQRVQSPADDDGYHAPLNGGCAAEAWCTTHVDL